ncbi:MAG: M20/M25/M40 family metallo-hydrolase [Phycisphaerae bacterium]
MKIDHGSKLASPMLVSGMLGGLAVMATSCTTPSGQRVDPSISIENVKAHISFLAHDDLGGRGTGSDGVDVAAGYIAGHFAAMGVQPAGSNGSYLQEFDTPRGGEVGGDTTLSCTGRDVLRVDEDFQPLGISAEGEFEGEVVFVGYGIISEEREYDDFANVDVEGKVALMLRREPEDWVEGRYSRNAFFAAKVRRAADAGAVAAIIVNRSTEGDPDELSPFRLGGRASAIPAIHMKRAVADEWLSRAAMPNLTSLQEQLDAGKTDQNAAIPDMRVKGNMVFERKRVPVRNVVGILPGKGPDRDEYVVIGGHYDHLGVARGEIYNGADDNASGTAGIIEVARKLADMKRRNRSALFIAFSAEEIGLRGSRHFVENTPVPTKDVIAMLNMDMIGRFDDAKLDSVLAAYGTGTGSGFDGMVTANANRLGINVKKEPSAQAPSDHAPFYNAGVPAMFFFTGIHEDYHQPEDDTEKINWKGTARVIDFVAGIAADLVNVAERPGYKKIDERPQIYRQP